MKKKFSAICMAMILLILTLAACGSKITVTFDYNYEGAPAAYSQKIAKGDVASPPADPVREDYKFTGWYKNAACTAAFDSEWGHDKDTVYYAGWEMTSVNVSFNWNYQGGSVTIQKVNIGGYITQISDPDRPGYLFTTWYTDPACTAEFNFDTKITAAITLYAGWDEITGDTCTVEFSNNYPGGGNYYSTAVNNGRRVTRPANPVRTNYVFVDWYSDQACTVLFNFDNFITQNTVIYALWYDIYTFEAEYTYVKDTAGAGLSSNPAGYDLIIRDANGQAGASNGYYVTYLYRFENELVFNITAEEDVKNAHIVLRLSAEGKSNMVITSDMWLVQVNGVNLDYPAMNFGAVPDITSGNVRPFNDWMITKTLSLDKGDNIIKLITNNNETIIGTMYATAPMIDCLYIYTNVELEWTVYYPDNLDHVVG